MPHASVRLLIVLAIMAGLAIVAAPAHASGLVGRDTSREQLRVNAAGIADVRYQTKASGRAHANRVIYWGAVNGQIKFHLDRSAGWKSHMIDPKKPFVDACRPYSGPALPFMVKGCTMRDGSHWVLQKWQRIISNYGGQSGQAELRLSHFTGEAAVIAAQTDWSYSGMWQHMFGTYTYKGAPVYGELVTSRGYVLDGRGRNLSIESLDSDYPGGVGRWARVNMFLSNKPSGQWCFGVSPKTDAALPDPLWAWGRTYTGRSASDQYRARAAGPGVSPDVETYFTANSRATYEAPDSTSQSGWRYNDAGRMLDAKLNGQILALRGNGGGGSCSTVN